jgi:hypothetical protein
MTASTETASTATITDVNVDVVRVYRRLLRAGLGLPPSPHPQADWPVAGRPLAGCWPARYVTGCCGRQCDGDGATANGDGLFAGAGGDIDRCDRAGIVEVEVVDDISGHAVWYGRKSSVKEAMAGRPVFT